MDAIVGDKLHNLMVDVLEASPLKEYMAGLTPCARRFSGGGGSGNGIGGHLDKLDPNDPVNAKAREEWEAQHKDEILKDLQQVFEKGDQPPTQAEIEKLVEALKGKTPDEFEKIKKMIKAARNPKSGKLDLDKAQTQVASDVVPEDGPKDRKIDYDKAKRLNEYYQKKIGWDPTTFIKEPGIKADSKEFADAVYDMQQATGAHADGIAGPGATVKFYQANGLDKDATYAEAVKVGQQEERARADAKAAAEHRKEAEALLADEKVAAAMAAPLPTEDELKQVLAGRKWDNLAPNSVQFIKVNGRPLIGMKTSDGHRLGAWFNFVERDFNGVPTSMIVKTSLFYALDEIVAHEAIRFSIIGKDGKPSHEFLFFSGSAKDSFTDLGLFFFARFFDFN
jgi:hypothetical protein